MIKNEAIKIENSVVLVTGGLGFIGSHLVRRILKENPKKVIVLDSAKYGAQNNLDSDSRIELFSHSLGLDSKQLLDRVLTDVDLVFHLAAEKHNQSKDSPEVVIDVNIKGTSSLFELALKNKVKKVVFSSSLYSYGKLTGEPFKETDLPLPKTVYGISKLCGERLIDQYTSSTGMQGNTLRYFFVYGPKQYSGMGYKSVILKNFEKIQQGLPPVVLGDGNQVLDYVFVDDVVDATVLAMTSNVSGEIFNVGSGEPTSINRLTEKMLAVSASSLKPIFGPPDWTAGSFRVGEMDKIQKILGWKASTSLEQGLLKTWTWLRERN